MLLSFSLNDGFVTNVLKDITKFNLLTDVTPKRFCLVYGIADEQVHTLTARMFVDERGLIGNFYSKLVLKASLITKYGFSLFDFKNHEMVQYE